MLVGLIGSYDVNDQFSVRLGYEGRENNENLRSRSNGYDKFGLGATYTTGPWAFTGDYYNISRDGINAQGEANTDSDAWSVGAYYKVSSSFDVFVEANDYDAPSVDRGTTLGDLTDNVYYLTGARYHF